MTTASLNLLICSTPVHGHVTPLLAVTRHLIASGHRVRFLTGTRYRDAVEAAGAGWVPLPAEADYDDRDITAAFPGREGLSGPAGIRYDLREIFLRPGPAQLAAVDAAIAEERPDAVLVESMFMGALLLLCRPGERPPVVNLGIVPLGLASRDTAPFGLGIPPKPGLAGRIRNRMLRFVAERIVFGSVQRYARELVERAGGTLTRDFMGSAALADAIVQFTVPSFEYPRSDLPASVHFVGPVSRTTPSTMPLPEWWGDLDGSRPVVHVTQGTVANTDLGALIDPTIEALADDDVLVVVSMGGREVPERAYPANVRIASYLPYDKLLPLTDVMVTNGGYGGVHFAMEHGVPLVTAGLTEDKAEVTARVAWSGAGINLRTDRADAASVRSAVRRLLSDPTFRERSAAIGRDIAASPGVAGLESLLPTLTTVRLH
ncbi:glycosyltransferase [Protaetiibacter intestinalis]|uniref:Glycosyltransferase n=1 Tax=Protaetiibacter intestinalis TaxID=2419774 RepID=A0A387BHX8_9MICO|nr:nucleotide disphospho-sugar-binding domain-containing protein [Protaetiibacter intestinalis]AYF98150.1 glycosyltransferase [Protaetiibacter intestinalis]